MPHFLFFRDGHLRDTVVGPNVPQLERALREHVPKADDPVVDPTVRNPECISPSIYGGERAR